MSKFGYQGRFIQAKVTESIVINVTSVGGEPSSIKGNPSVELVATDSTTGTNSNGGTVEITAGNGDGTGDGGDIDIKTGTSTGSGAQGIVTVDGPCYSTHPAYFSQMTFNIVAGGAHTITGAEVASGFLERNPTAGGVSDAGPTAAQIVAALPFTPVVGMTFPFYLRNQHATSGITITEGAGTSGLTGALDAKTTNTYLVRLDNVTATTESVTFKHLGASIFT